MSMLSTLSKCLRVIVWKPAPLCLCLPAWWPAAGTGRSWKLLQNTHCSKRSMSFLGARERGLSLTPYSVCLSLAAMWKPWDGQTRVIHILGNLGLRSSLKWRFHFWMKEISSLQFFKSRANFGDLFEIIMPLSASLFWLPFVLRCHAFGRVISFHTSSWLHFCVNFF